MEHLTDGDIIKLAGWRHNYATVRTLKAWLAEKPNRVALSNAPYAWSLKSLSVVCDDPTHAKKHNEALNKARVVTTGETVLIDGKPYMIRVSPYNEKEARNSDPIHFYPVPEAI